ncbi:MAG: CHASE3 domain-containing protein, partial [Acetivibrionales bacterium]
MGFFKRRAKPYSKKFSLFTSIRTKLISGFMVTIVPIVLLGIISYNSAFNSIKDTATSTSFETLKQLGKNVEISFTKYEELSTQIMLNDLVQSYLLLNSKDNTYEAFQIG